MFHLSYATSVFRGQHFQSDQSSLKIYIFWTRIYIAQCFTCIYDSVRLYREHSNLEKTISYRRLYMYVYIYIYIYIYIYKGAPQFTTPPLVSAGITISKTHEEEHIFKYDVINKKKTCSFNLFFFMARCFG